MSAAFLIAGAVVLYATIGAVLAGLAMRWLDVDSDDAAIGALFWPLSVAIFVLYLACQPFVWLARKIALASTDEP